MTFHDRQLNSMTFQAWKLKHFNSMIFQVFHDLCEPCLFFVSSASPSSERRADAQAWLVFTSDASTKTSSNIRALISSWKRGWRKHKDQNISISLSLRFCLRCVKTKHSISTRNLLHLANWSICSRFPASEHLNKMADSAVDFDAYVDVRFHLA